MDPLTAFRGNANGNLSATNKQRLEAFKNLTSLYRTQVEAANGQGARFKALLSAMRALMRRRATRPIAEAVHRATLTRGGDLRLGREIVRIYRAPDNAPVARVVAERPDRFLGWIFLNPSLGRGALDELERHRDVPGMVGVKLHPHWHDYRTDVLGPVLARAEELGMPALVHLGFGRRGDFRAIAVRHPGLRLIAAHAGFPFVDDLWACRDTCPNLYVDLSSPYLDERLARDAVAALGARRCLFGTDAPYGFHGDDGSYDYGAIRGWIDRMPVSEAERDAILGGTFADIVSRRGHDLSVHALV